MDEKAPTLSFQCPKLWQDMSGNETTRFCDQCGHDVHNISLLDEESRNELLQQAKTERVCGLFYQDLEGNLVTAKSQEELSKKMRALRLAALAGGALTLTSCAALDDSNIPLPGMMCVDEK